MLDEIVEWKTLLYFWNMKTQIFCCCCIFRATLVCECCLKLKTKQNTIKIIRVKLQDNFIHFWRVQVQSLPAKYDHVSQFFSKQTLVCHLLIKKMVCWFSCFSSTTYTIAQICSRIAHELVFELNTSAVCLFYFIFLFNDNGNCIRSLNWHKYL